MDVEAMAKVPVWRRRRFWRGMTIWQVMLGVMLAGIAALTAVDLYQSGQEANNRNESVLLLQRLRVGVERTFLGGPELWGGEHAAGAGVGPEGIDSGRGAGGHGWGE